MRNRTVPALVGLCLFGLTGSVAAQPSTHLLVIDQDAALVSDDLAGALFNVDLEAPTDAAPEIEAAATLGAPFQLISGVAISPIDGRAYVADLGLDLTPPFNPVGAIYAVDGRTGDIETIWQGAPLVQPFSLAFMPDGRLLIVDPEADPASLGPGPGCGNHGAVFVIDTAACAAAPCAPRLLSDGRLHAFPPTVRSAFEEPLGIAYDPVRDRIYVSDACASQVGWFGSLLAVDPSTGRVTLVSSTDQFLSLLTVDVRPDGTPLVVDQGAVAGDSVVWSIDVANTDPESNASQLTSGTQYSVIQDVSVDAADRVYLVDWGDYDPVDEIYIAPPAIWTVDETNPNPGTNGVLVNDSVAWLTPVAGAIVPLPAATRVTPPIVNGPTNVVIEGTGLNAGLVLDFGPEIAISSVDVAPGYPAGTAIQATLTPTASAVVPRGCEGNLDLSLTHPFGGTQVLVDAVQLEGNDGGLSPQPPWSTRGDANRDGIVDGLDLAILGLHFGAEYCDGHAFWNDADFDNNDIIDGSDLALLAAYFGVRF